MNFTDSHAKCDAHKQSKRSLSDSMGDYDTSINVIGGIRESGVLFSALTNFFNSRAVEHTSETSPSQSAIRTEQSRRRIDLMIRSSVLKFRNRAHEDLLRCFHLSKAPMPDREMVLFWHLALNNRLLREISTNVFSKAYFAGRAGLGKDDLVGYLKEFFANNADLRLSWSESTIETLATKYLNLMTKLNLLTGGKSKSFTTIRTSSEALTLFLYFTKLHQPEAPNILVHELLPLCFVSPDDLIGRLKKLALKNLFRMTFNGVALNIELTHPYEEIAHVLYR